MQILSHIPTTIYPSEIFQSVDFLKDRRIEFNKQKTEVVACDLVSCLALATRDYFDSKDDGLWGFLVATNLPQIKPFLQYCSSTDPLTFGSETVTTWQDMFVRTREEVLLYLQKIERLIFTKVEPSFFTTDFETTHGYNITRNPVRIVTEIRLVKVPQSELEFQTKIRIASEISDLEQKITMQNRLLTHMIEKKISLENELKTYESITKVYKG